jgi:osmotically-inducible protein OsmY
MTTNDMEMHSAGQRDEWRTHSLAADGTPPASDASIRADIEAELQWEPGIEDQKIFVHVLHGVATLKGEVTSCQARRTVAEVAKRCAGVIAVANDVDVVSLPETFRSDSQIAEDLGQALRRHPLTRSSAIVPVVRDGNVMLCGAVKWPLQLKTAISLGRRTAGVKTLGCDVRIAERQFGERMRAALSRMRKFILLRVSINRRTPH